MKTDVTAKDELQSLTFPLDISQTKKDRKLQIGSERHIRINQGWSALSSLKLKESLHMDRRHGGMRARDDEGTVEEAS